MTSISRARTILGAIALIASCKPAETPKHPEYVERICSAECQRQMACGSREGVSSCVVRCTMSGTPRRVYESREYVDEVLRCISESGCRIHDGQEVAGADCRERVASAVVPSPLVYMHCRRASVRYDDCGYVYPLEQCIEGTKLYDETVVRELDHCLEHKCGHVGRCVYSVVGEGEGRTRLKEK